LSQHHAKATRSIFLFRELDFLFSISYHDKKVKKNSKKKGKVMKKMLFAASFAAVLFNSSAYSSEIKIDTSVLEMISQMVSKMQQETMMAKYAEMPFKDQMRGKMMTERASQNFMMQVIQPQMMQKNMGAEKLRLMNQMSQF
jgi:hypothetical protein